MRKLSTTIAIIAVLSLAGLAGVAKAASPQSGNYVSVYNHGNNPGDSCTNTLYASDGVNVTFVGFYSGFETLVLQGDGLSLLQCHMNLVYGPGVGSTLVLDFGSLHQVYTPSGVANYSLHG